MSPARRPLHPVWAFLVSAVLCLAAFFMAGVFSEAVAGRRPLLLEVLFRTLLALLVAALFVWLLTVVDGVHGHRIAALGLPGTTGSLKQFALGCGVGSLLAVIAVAPVAIGGHPSVSVHFGVRILPRAAAVLLVLVVGALEEELMFRGYPFQHLEQGIGAPGAVAVFSVLFGVVHLSNPGASVWGLINTVLIGIVLSITYLRTRALWFPWGIHLAWNTALGFVFGLPVSGLRFFNVILRTNVAGPKWLTGGSYGVEASATGAFAVLVGVVLVSKLAVSRLAPAPPHYSGAPLDNSCSSRI
jgi:CAAX protease family protein